MAYNLEMSVDFGSSYGGLSTVGYQLIDSTGTVVTTRSTGGVIGLGFGSYQALVSFPDGFRGTIYWDTAPSGSIYAVEAMNPEFAEYLDMKLSSVVVGASGSVWSAPVRSLTDKINFALTAGEHTNIASDVQTGLTAQGYSSTRAGYLDTLNNLVSNIWNAATRTLSAFGFNVTVASNLDKTGYQLELAQVIGPTQAGGTLGRALQLARAQARGNWTIDPNTNTLTLYDTDGTTVVAIFALSPVGGPWKQRAVSNE